MQLLEVSGAVRHIYAIRRLTGGETNLSIDSDDAQE
jgi:hypothetical protein